MFAAEVARYLDEQGVCQFDETGVGGDAFVEILPDSPDEVMAVYSRGGSGADQSLPYDSPGIQIIVRGTRNPLAAHAKTQTI